VLEKTTASMSRARADVEENGRARHVVPIVQGGLAHRLADERQGGEVHDRGRPVALDGLVQAGAVQDVADLDRSPGQRPAVAGGEVVVGDRLIAGPGQRLTGLAADVAGTPR
jgi:hypothetical protein